MPQIDPRQFAMSLLKRNPQIANNPQAQSYLQLIQNGSNEEGEKVAMNLCKTYGVTPEQAMQQVSSFFHIPL